jgi:hypothetical protein
MTEKELLEEAKERFKGCVDDNAQERQKQLADLVFCDLEQWPTEIRANRENDINGPRPVLTVDKINQYITQVVNNLRQNKPSVKVRPIDSGSDLKTAEVFQGIVRHIEDISSADIAYMTAGESAVKIGEGYFRVMTDYVDETSFDQEIFIKQIPDTFSCYLGPHNMPDGSDAEYGFILEDIPKERFERLYPKAKAQSADFLNIMSPANYSYWTSSEYIRVCEYFYYEYKGLDIISLEDGSVMELEQYKEILAAASAEGIEVPPIQNRRKTKVKSVKWCKLTGLEILEKNDWAGKYIPIIKVVGKASNVGGKKGFRGLVRQAKDSLRAYNYWFSTITEKLALSPKVPFIGAVGQFDTHAAKWGKANNTNYAYLEYDPIEVNGMVVPAPQRQAPAAMEIAMLKQLEVIEHDIQTALGMYKASVGEGSPQQSGKAILGLKRESDTGVFHFQDNLGLSIRHLGRVLVDLIPKIYDTPRLIRILGEDGTHSSAVIDPSQPQSVTKVQDMQGQIKTIYNLGVGTYDVTVTSGPSYTTKRMEQADMMMQITQNQPEMMQTIGDLLFQSLDWPMADKISERLKKMLPPQLVEPEEGQPQIPQQIQQAMQQIEQQGQELQQKAQALSQAEEEITKKSMAVEKGAVELMSHEAALKNDATKLELDKYAFELEQREKELASNSVMVDSETKLKIAEMKQETDILISLHKAQHDESMAERMKKEVPEAPEVEEPEEDDDSEESGKWDAIMTKLNEFGDKFQKTMEDKDEKIEKNSAKLETQLSVLAKKVEVQEKENLLVGSLQDIGKALTPKKRKVIRGADGKIEGIE